MQRRSLIPLLFPAAMLPVLAANGALIYLALQTRPVLVAERPYEDGRSYNRELAAAQAQAALGWSAEIEAPDRAGVAGPVAVRIRSRDGAPVAGLEVEMRVWRPVGNVADLHLHLAAAEPGRYAAEFRLPLPGQWQFDVVARRSADEFVTTRRVVAR